MSADTRLAELGGNGAGRGRRAGVLGAGGAAPAELHALLPDARVVRGRRGHRAGDLPPCLAAAETFGGAYDALGLAVQDRHQRRAWTCSPSAARARDRRRGAVAAALPGPAAGRAARGRRERAGDRRRRAETIELAYLVAVQHPRRARGSPILWDVLGWLAKDEELPGTPSTP